MKAIIVGGFWDNENPKPSKLINQIAHINIDIQNSGNLEELQYLADTISKYDLVLWMPNIDNKHELIVPKKKRGAVLVVSKVLRPGRKRIDAVTRIYSFHGNAVITVNPETNPKDFELIDALNVSWGKSNSLEDIIKYCTELYDWTKAAEREPTQRIYDDMDRFLKLNHEVAEEVKKNQIRFFGNTSTRCQKLFPTRRLPHKNAIMVSARNTNKNELTRDDMIMIHRNNEGKLSYYGVRKASVDAPIQFELYQRLPNINFMIHGHHQLKNVPSTKNYVPCGDKREVNEVMNIVHPESNIIQVNLKNHGFILMSDSLDTMEELIQNTNFQTI